MTAHSLASSSPGAQGCINGQVYECVCVTGKYPFVVHCAALSPKGATFRCRAFPLPRYHDGTTSRRYFGALERVTRVRGLPSPLPQSVGHQS
eukprot:COSAG01_NODE_4839_length_4694_cov_16.413058_4_plen_92_part_00